MAMTKVNEDQFNAMLEKIEEYDTQEDMVNGTQLVSYYRFDKRFAQEMHSQDGLSFYLLDDQHCERLLKIQSQGV